MTAFQLPPFVFSSSFLVFSFLPAAWPCSERLEVLERLLGSERLLGAKKR
jgi:hypothetical protein